MRTQLVLVLCAVFALTVGVATATAGGGNSANAKLCQKNGWQSLVTSTGETFASEEACVSYAAKGGTLVPNPEPEPKTKSQIDCESFGGTFSTDPATDNGGGEGVGFLWSCNGVLLSNSDFDVLANDCFFVDDGSLIARAIDFRDTSCYG
jgi:hypothetical protein